ncbi:Hypothetical predicted protein [Xyrichtys novacula]|uniref:Uncharacterized protein n=1 Tax=Xyrichtys novacula TaxID=13765 RepID=A0AAV1HMS1_XYRNO|nr:Hypothetical predicted protein [Xyrichtys novacula]
MTDVLCVSGNLKVTSKSQTPKMTPEEAKDDVQLRDAEGDWMNKTTWRSKIYLYTIDTRKDESEDDEQPKEEEKMRTAAKMVNMDKSFSA